MKPIVYAIFLSITLHLLAIYFMYEKKVEPLKQPSSTKIKQNSNVHFVQLQAKAVAQKKSQQKQQEKPKKEIQKKRQKVTQKKPTYIPVKKVVKQAKRKVVKKEPKTIQRKPIEKTEALPNYSKLSPTKLQKKTLDDFLAQPVLDTKFLDEVTQSYIKLYGEEYNNFTKVQKVYLQKNLKDIGRITQKYLRYPRISIQTRQSGMNIIEFTLYPNGDISTPMISSSSGYTALDKNSIETIEIAYKDYPRPKEPTKIKIYVKYILY